MGTKIGQKSNADIVRLRISGVQGLRSLAVEPTRADPFSEIAFGLKQARVDFIMIQSFSKSKLC